jgi:CRP-like cAMP-binding protein
MRLICDRAECAGRRTPEGILIETDMHAEDFAMMVGTTRQSVSTIFTELDRTGLIRRPNRKQLLIPDLARLKKELQAL